jgi:retron-type reverse transcriptase
VVEVSRAALKAARAVFGRLGDRKADPATVEATGKTVILTCDVEKAFDSVPHDRLFAVLRPKLGDRTTALVERIVRGNGEKGIGQGAPLSLLLLNVFLDDVLDKPLQRDKPGATVRR